MKNSLQPLLFLLLGSLMQAALAADATPKPAAANLEIQIFENDGQPAQNMGIDTSTGEPIRFEHEVDTALPDYRTHFLNAKTAQAMADFIAQHAARDPDKLVPRARIRMRTFAAFESALNTHQCAEAKKQHQRITRYKIVIPFSFEECERARSVPKADASTTASRSRSTARNPTSQVLLPGAAKLETCPTNLGYLRSRMVYKELREHPSFDEPIDGIIRKAGSLDQAILEVKRLIGTNQRSLEQAAVAMQHYQPLAQGDAREFRCAKSEVGLCGANYYYHLLREGMFYYAELLNSLNCQKTGTMQHSPYEPAPLKEAVISKASPGIRR